LGEKKCLEKKFVLHFFKKVANAIFHQKKYCLTPRISTFTPPKSNSEKPLLWRNEFVLKRCNFPEADHNRQRSDGRMAFLTI